MRALTIASVALPFAVAFALGGSVGISHTMGYEGWFGVGARPAAPSAPPLEMLEADLRLAPAQREGFRGFKEYCDCGFGGCGSRIGKARAELGRAIMAEPPDPDRVERARLDLLEAYEECQRELVDRLVKLGSTLDADQKARLVERLFPVPSGDGCKCGGLCGRQGN